MSDGSWKPIWSVKIKGGGGPSVEAPIGFSSGVSYGSGEKEERHTENEIYAMENDPELVALRKRKMWEAARSPLMGVVTSFIMTHFFGSNVQLFSIIMIGMTCLNALKTLFSLSSGLSCVCVCHHHCRSLFAIW